MSCANAIAGMKTNANVRFPAHGPIVSYTVKCLVSPAHSEASEGGLSPAASVSGSRSRRLRASRWPVPTLGSVRSTGTPRAAGTPRPAPRRSSTSDAGGFGPRHSARQSKRADAPRSGVRGPLPNRGLDQRSPTL